MFTRSSRATIHEKLTQSSRRSRGHLLFRIPLCMFFGFMLMFEFMAYVWVRLLVAALEYVFARRGRRGKKLHAARRAAKTYEEYQDVCKQLDAQEEREEWKYQSESPHYDSRLIQAAVVRIRTARESGDAKKVMASLHTTSNYGGIMNLDLYTKTWHGTKKIIEEFVDEVTASIEWLTDKELDPYLDSERAAFIHKSRTEFGNTSFMMSGGAMLGLYHLGVLKGLITNNVLPTYISGTSAGAVIGCYIGTRLDEEIMADFDDTTELWMRFGEKGPFWGGKFMQLQKAATNGTCYEFSNFYNKILWFTRDLTFREAYEKTGRVLNITCTPTKTKVKGHPPVVLNYITAPHVPIAYAVIASSCVPFLMEPSPIMERVWGRDGQYKRDENGKYKLRPFLDSHDEEEMSNIKMRDGTFETDLPVTHMRHTFNSQFNVVSQVNPHVFPFFFNNTGEAGKPLRSWHNKGGWRGGFVLSLAELWLKEDMRKNLKILASLRLLWDMFGVDWSNLWLQESMGDITITPPFQVSDFWNISTNLPATQEGRDMLDWKIETAERLTWKAVPMIANRMKIQRALDKLQSAHGTTSNPSSPNRPASPINWARAESSSA